jgi:hypothetical protein
MTRVLAARPGGGDKTPAVLVEVGTLADALDTLRA